MSFVWDDSGEMTIIIDAYGPECWFCVGCSFQF